MKIVIFTSNSIRHKYLANTLSKNVDESLIISECKPNESFDPSNESANNPIQEHFQLRFETEKIFFPQDHYFDTKTIPLLYKEASLPYVCEIIKNYDPDAMFVFGSSIIRGSLLSLKPGKFINLHLGISPYYRGTGTNFWPFVNKELEYVGSTIHHLDEGIDSGEIICHVRPEFESGDNVHTVGLKVIQKSVDTLIKILNQLKSGQQIKSVKQWEVPNPRYYRAGDFDEKILQQYKDNLRNGLVEDYIQKPKEIKLVNL